MSAEADGRYGWTERGRLHAQIEALTGMRAAEVAAYAARWPRYCREMAVRYPDEVLVVTNSDRGFVRFVPWDKVWRTLESGEVVLTDEVDPETVQVLRRETTPRGFPRPATAKWVNSMIERIEADRLADAKARALELGEAG